MTGSFKVSVVGVCAALLAACGGGGETAETPQPEASAPAPTVSTETPPPAETQIVTTETAETAPAAAPASEGSPEFADLPEPYKTASYSRGKRVFRTCSACHMLDPEAGNLVGPNLHGMFDRKAGEMENYTYSKALQDADFQWTAEELDNWLANPNSYLPGNNMSFSGVRREPDRIAVIAYLLVESAK